MMTILMWTMNLGDFSHDKSIKSVVFSPKVSDLWRFCLRKSRLHRMKSQKQCGIGKLVPETDSISISGEPW